MKTKTEKIKLTRPEKILLVLYGLSKGTSKKIKFEDIVVKAFKKYPDDFHLRDYVKYPDSEAVGKEIYRTNLKRGGLLDYGNKIFSLTEHGLEIVERLRKQIMGEEIVPSVRFSRYAEREISRVESLESFKLFLQGKESKIIDTDFYNYLGVTVRTEKRDFLGRLETIVETMKELKRFEDRNPLYCKILEFNKFMTDKFKDTVDYYKKN